MNPEVRKEFVKFLTCDGFNISQTLNLNLKRSSGRCKTCEKIKNIHKAGRKRLVKRNQDRSVNTRFQEDRDISNPLKKELFSKDEIFRMKIELANSLRYKIVNGKKKKRSYQEISTKLFKYGYSRTHSLVYKKTFISCLLRGCKNKKCKSCDGEAYSFYSLSRFALADCVRMWKKDGKYKVVKLSLDEIQTRLTKAGRTRKGPRQYKIDHIKCLVGECSNDFSIGLMDTDRLVKDFLAKQDQDLFGKRFNKAKPGVGRCLAYIFVERGKYETHYHLAVKVPKGKEQEYIDRSKINWKGTISSGDCRQTIKTWNAVGWSNYIIKDCSDINDYIVSTQFQTARFT